MTIHSKFQPDEACERGHCCCVAYYSADEVRGFFADFFGRGEWKDYQIKAYIWDESTSKTHAIVCQKVNQEVSEWAMNVVTRVPYLIAKFPTKSMNATKRRPRKPGSAIWRATKAWENR